MRERLSNSRISVRAPYTFPASGAGVGTRDPAVRPGGTYSIWNYPIGQNASYTTSFTLGNGATWSSLSSNAYHLQLTTGESYYNWYQSRSDDATTTICMNTPQQGFANTLYGTYGFPRFVNFSGAIGQGPGPFIGPPCTVEPIYVVISADHLTAFEMIDPLITTSGSTSCGSSKNQLYQASGDTFASCCVNVDLKGPGIRLGLGGTSLSGFPGDDMGIWLNQNEEASPAPLGSFGITSGQPFPAGGSVSASQMADFFGVIRQGELVASSGNGIMHAIGGCFVDGSWYNSGGYNSSGYVWPASQCDACGQSSPSGLFHEGSLLAIPWSVNLAQHSFQTVQGLNLANALQRYGMYPHDSGGSNGNISLKMEYGATSNDLPSGGQSNGTAFGNDIQYILGVLALVTNSCHSNGGPVQGGYKLDGGDGTVDPTLIAPDFAPQYGGGKGRYS